MKTWGFTFSSSHPRIRVTGLLLSVVLVLLAAGTGQALAADLYVGGAGASASNNNLVIRDYGLPDVPGGLAGAHCHVLCW